MTGRIVYGLGKGEKTKYQSDKQGKPECKVHRHNK